MPNRGICRRKVTPNGAQGFLRFTPRNLVPFILSKKPAATAYDEASAIYSVECFLDNCANAEREAVQDEVIRGTVFEGPLMKGMEMQAKLIGFSRRRVRAWIFALLVFAVGVTNVWADTTGRQDFDANCASCHGKDGRGHGEALYVIPGIKPPDLTQLTRSNGGVFPAERVYQSIDGRAGIPAHSRTDMPFWGTTLQQEGKEFTPESEAKVKARISNMVSYIESIQEK